jgi:hypothetical protein
MKKLLLVCATAAIAATAAIGSAEAKPGFGGGFKPWPTFNPHPHWHGGGIGLGLGVGLGGPTYVANDDCFYVRKRVFIPGYGVVVKRKLVCS